MKSQPAISRFSVNNKGKISTVTVKIIKPYNLSYNGTKVSKHKGHNFSVAQCDNWQLAVQHSELKRFGAQVSWWVLKHPPWVSSLPRLLFYRLWQVGKRGSWSKFDPIKMMARVPPTKNFPKKSTALFVQPRAFGTSKFSEVSLCYIQLFWSHPLSRRPFHSGVVFHHSEVPFAPRSSPTWRPQL